MPFEVFVALAAEEIFATVAAEAVFEGIAVDAFAGAAFEGATAFGEAGFLAGEGAAGLEGAAAFGEAGVLAGEGASAIEGALPFGEAALQAAAPAVNAGVTAADVLSGIKTVAPYVSAANSLMGALSGASQVKQANSLAAKATGAAPAVAPELPQAAVDPDLTALRKKNALLFGLDSPASTDLTSNTATNVNVGRATLLGGSSKLGS